jgi:hypothetical protein
MGPKEGLNPKPLERMCIIDSRVQSKSQAIWVNFMKVKYGKFGGMRTSFFIDRRDKFL